MPRHCRALLATAAAAMLLGAPAVLDAKTIRGDYSNDRLTGTVSADRLFGASGADRLFGLGGRDQLYGEFGADALFGGPGNDRLFGGYDRDRLEGGPGADFLRGDQDADRLLGGLGNDALYGGDGDDVLGGGAGGDRLFGDDGDDRISARGGGSDRVVCGEGEDTVVADLSDVVAADCENVTPPEAKPVGTTRANPYPAGAVYQTSDGWQLQVLSFNPDAVAAVLAENQFNDPPPPGEVFAMARVRATLVAGESDTFGGSYRLRVVGPSAVVRSTFENSCGVIPDALPDAQTFRGGVVEGNICWSVPAGDVGGLVMIDDSVLSEQQRFFALQ